MRKRNLTAIGFAIASGAIVASSASAQLNDNFDSYAAGSGLAGQGGWSLWYTGGSNALISSAQSNSAPNSVRLLPNADVVFEFSGISDGQWIYRAMTYMPSTSTGDAYIILMNGYGSSTEDNWSVQVRFGASDLTVESDFGGETAALVTDQWAEFRVEIDLDAMIGTTSVGFMDIYYNGTLMAEELFWIENAGVGGTTDIACTDLYNLNCTEFFVDDVSLLPAGGCPADYNGDDEVDILDFLDFIDDFSTCDQQAGPCGSFGNADFNGDTLVDILDFLDFIDRFASGC